MVSWGGEYPRVDFLTVPGAETRSSLPKSFLPEPFPNPDSHLSGVFTINKRTVAVVRDY